MLREQLRYPGCSAASRQLCVEGSDYSSVAEWITRIDPLFSEWMTTYCQSHKRHSTFQVGTRNALGYTDCMEDEPKKHRDRYDTSGNVEAEYVDDDCTVLAASQSWKHYRSKKNKAWRKHTKRCSVKFELIPQ